METAIISDDICVSSFTALEKTNTPNISIPDREDKSNAACLNGVMVVGARCASLKAGEWFKAAKPILLAFARLGARSEDMAALLPSLGMPGFACSTVRKHCPREVPESMSGEVSALERIGREWQRVMFEGIAPDTRTGEAPMTLEEAANLADEAASRLGGGGNEKATVLFSLLRIAYIEKRLLPPVSTVIEVAGDVDSGPSQSPRPIRHEQSAQFPVSRPPDNHEQNPQPGTTRA